MVGDVRRRVSFEHYRRRGRVGDPAKSEMLVAAAFRPVFNDREGERALRLLSSFPLLSFRDLG
ncbi:hypothetical protein [Saccharopolyspora hattusasensis]|uniref:hypothetical protein n=1 Tax=Saccharopolyspora hattusasensis TaxID=1128679 RepID=UPI003D96957A